jgi:hypothetical protein
VPTARDNQKLQHTQQEDNLHRILLLVKSKSSNSSGIKSFLYKILPKELLSGEKNHSISRLLTVNKPIK